MHPPLPVFEARPISAEPLRLLSPADFGRLGPTSRWRRFRRRFTWRPIRERVCGCCRRGRQGVFAEWRSEGGSVFRGDGNEVQAPASERRTLRCGARISMLLRENTPSMSRVDNPTPPCDAGRNAAVPCGGVPFAEARADPLPTVNTDCPLRTPKGVFADWSLGLRSRLKNNRHKILKNV